MWQAGNESRSSGLFKVLYVQLKSPCPSSWGNCSFWEPLLTVRFLKSHTGVTACRSPLPGCSAWLPSWPSQCLGGRAYLTHGCLLCGAWLCTPPRSEKTEVGSVVVVAQPVLPVHSRHWGHFDHTLTSLACLAAWVAFLMSGRSATVV